MADSPAPKRKGLARLRAQKAARSETDSSAAGNSPRGERGERDTGASEMYTRPTSSNVPRHMRLGNVPPGGGGAEAEADSEGPEDSVGSRPGPPRAARRGAPLSQEELVAQRVSARNKAMGMLSPEDLDKNALRFAETGQFLGIYLTQFYTILPNLFKCIVVVWVL
jgi:hypothetical protein